MPAFADGYKLSVCIFSPKRSQRPQGFLHGHQSTVSSIWLMSTINLELFLQSKQQTLDCIVWISVIINKYRIKFVGLLSGKFQHKYFHRRLRHRTYVSLLYSACSSFWIFTFWYRAFRRSEGWYTIITSGHYACSRRVRLDSVRTYVRRDYRR